MYQKQKESFGSWEKITLLDDTTGNGFSIVPARGANLLQLFFSGKNIIEGYQSADELAAGDWGKSAVLFPFPNRLKDGKYEHGGVIYHFPINDAAGNNALHGLGVNKKFEVKNIAATSEMASVTCVYQDKGSDSAYPFAFDVEIVFRINNAHSFEVEMYFQNNSDQVIPVGLGWHPYFFLDEKIEDTSIQLPGCQLVEVDKEMIPTGVKYDYQYFEKQKKIGRTVLDNCFLLKKSTSQVEITLEGKKGKLRYWQETGKGLWNFFQVFTPPMRTSVAIEPMTCNVDAFNNKEGLVMLEPKERMGGKFGVDFYDLG